MSGKRRITRAIAYAVWGSVDLPEIVDTANLLLSFASVVKPCRRQVLEQTPHKQWPQKQVCRVVESSTDDRHVTL